ncbi:MAG TPA: molybdate ABC transporter substrate-binding protein [Stackebrandtia sp.]|uniref:molybdate ABC transporter substrate-binding protein n=1 Tax=Stackebrandtia sp. TaxID=2023065 RepID=UPI002D58B796|nr:molybdate ABC transporter substrate-binding protein [Stackebrandtia sp.]HZE40631.1 molybdate ABC transporter substrate-binding protein [Stackebrandtia sp.]
MRKLLVLSVVLLGAGTLTACGQDTDRITVLAASSLTDVFGHLAKDFEADHDGVTVKNSFGGSPTLAQQVIEGAPADVIATASPDTMKTVTGAHMTDGKPQVFTRNRPVLVVPPDNPGKVTGIKDLGRDKLRVALCAPKVPCGVVARDTAKAAGVTVKPDTEEENVRSVLSKVASGEVDVGVVYVTDVTKEVKSIDIPHATTTKYQIAVVKDASPNAKAWVDFVTGPRGQKALKDAGFTDA